VGREGGREGGREEMGLIIIRIIMIIINVLKGKK